MDKVELNIAPHLCPGFEKMHVKLVGSCSIYNFMEKWSSENAPGFTDQIFIPGTRRLREGILILINGKAVQQPFAHESLVKSGDVINIIPIIIGG